MKIWIKNHYFSEKEKPALAEEIRDVLGNTTHDNVELFGYFSDSYEGALAVNDLSMVFEIVDHDSRDVLASAEETITTTQNWVRY